MRKLKTNSKRMLALVAAFVVTVSSIPAMQLITVKAAGTVPTNLVYTEEEDVATIKWNAVSGATAYKVYEADSRYGTYTPVDEVTENTYADETFEGKYYKISAVVSGKETAKSDPISYEIQTFGKSAYIFEDTDNMTEVNKVLKDTYDYAHPYSGQFSSNRYAFLFKPSTKQYNVTAGVGYYTQIAGLGFSPEDVTIQKMICEGVFSGRKYDGGINMSALCNFWRSVENFSTPEANTMWAVSQATAMRRLNFTKGNLLLHHDGGYASGGFLADSKVARGVYNGSQQQWLSRNIEAKGEYNPAVWNNVLVGSETTIKASNWPNGSSTVVEQTPEIAEKPFLVYDDELEEYGIALPPLEENKKGASWDNLTKEDYGYISIDDCYVAKPGQSADTINAGIADKEALILTPGVYELDKAIEIKNEDMVVLGLGYATIKPTKGNQCMTVSDVEGVKIAGVLFDAGRVESETLLTVGTKNTTAGSAENPIVLSDCFFRVGGADKANCRTKSCVIINSNEVICDNFWVWRADHGDGVAWNKNTCDNGVIFNGKNATAYGLMVEHFQKVQTQWNADGGRCYMYQSELPYDITSQNVWNEPGSYGYTDYKVASNVNTHEGYGIGIYSCYQAATCFLKSAVTCPDKPGVKFTNVCSYSLSGNGGIDKVINNAGYGVYAGSEMAKIMSYCNGKYTCDKTGSRAQKIIWTANSSTVSKVTYTGKAQKPKVTVKYKGITLREGVDYTVTYKNNVKIGKAKAVVKGINNFSDQDEVTFKIVPKKATIKKVKVSKKKIKITVKKLKGVKGYQVAYATNSKFKKKKTKKFTKTTFTIKKTKNVKYYVKVRGYKGSFYGTYSKVKKCKKK